MCNFISIYMFLVTFVDIEYLITNVQVIQSKVKENYNMNYWIKKCDPKVVSCFVAQV